jgi:hypothetical protein
MPRFAWRLAHCFRLISTLIIPIANKYEAIVLTYHMPLIYAYRFKSTLAKCECDGLSPTA